MNKKLYLCLIATLSILATSCSPASPEEFADAARDKKFNVTQDNVDEDVWRADRHGCTVIFYDKSSQNEANELYEDGLENKKAVERAIGSKQTKEINFWGYHHFSIKTATKLVYGTQVKNTFLYIEGRRECEELIEPMVEKLGHHY